MTKSKTSFHIKIEIPQEISQTEPNMDLIRNDLLHHIRQTMGNYFELREDKSKTNNIQVKLISSTTNLT